MEGIGDAIEGLFKLLIGTILVLVAVLVCVVFKADLNDILLPVTIIAGWEFGQWVYRWVFGL